MNHVQFLHAVIIGSFLLWMKGYMYLPMHQESSAKFAFQRLLRGTLWKVDTKGIGTHSRWSWWLQRWQKSERCYYLQRAWTTELQAKPKLQKSNIKCKKAHRSAHKWLWTKLYQYHQRHIPLPHVVPQYFGYLEDQTNVLKEEDNKARFMEEKHYEKTKVMLYR